MPAVALTLPQLAAIIRWMRSRIPFRPNIKISPMMKAISFNSPIGFRLSDASQCSIMSRSRFINMVARSPNVGATGRFPFGLATAALPGDDTFVLTALGRGGDCVAGGVRFEDCPLLEPAMLGDFSIP